MLRVVFVILLAVSLLAVAMPVVEDARDAAAGQTIRTQLDRLDRVAGRLLERNDLPPPGVAGPRRVVTLSFPERTWANAGLDWLRIPTDGPTPSWQVGGREPQVWRPSTPITVSEDLDIRDGGRVRLVLTARRGANGPVVVVSRPDFMSDGETTGTHAGSPSDFEATLHRGR